MSNNKKKSNVGRKPSDDPIIAVQFYTKQSVITANGGMEASREKCKVFLNEQATKKNITKTKNQLLWQERIS